MQNHNPIQGNTLYLWYLGHPVAPILVGDLNLVMSARGVSLRYDAGWLNTGFPLSEDIPLVNIEFFLREKDTAAGAVDNARPDRVGLGAAVLDALSTHIDRPFLLKQRQALLQQA